MYHWPRVAMHIWYVALLDIWYPLPQEKREAKHIGGKVRDDLGKIHEQSNKVERRLYEEVAKRLHMSVHGLYYLLPEEVIDALQKGRSKENLAHKRRKLCVSMTLRSQHRIVHGIKALDILERYAIPKEGTRKQNVLRGAVANRGIVHGRVRIIRKDNDFDRFCDGEILVALQTMVHYLPIMKRSKAILTEFGGLTSHAAIVSRELKKPCVIGISNLLVSVKDGDLVEVDANKGKVTILKRS